MRRICLFVLLVFCLLLSACGTSAAEARYRAFSDALARRDTLHFTARLRAEYPDRSARFTLQYAMEDGEQTVTVTEPEIIAGIRARLLPGETKLEYENLILDTGSLNQNGLTPMSALPLLVEAMRSGHLDSCWQEGGELAVQLILTDDTSAVIRFREEDMTPTAGELLCDGTVTVFCEISDWR